MGARQSKRSVDITTTPKKGEGDGGPVDGENVGKVEKIAEVDLKVTTNGAAVHTAADNSTTTDEPLLAEKETADTEASSPAKEAIVVENGVSDTEEAKTPSGDETEATEDATQAAVEKSAESTDKSADESGDSKKKEKKEKSKKKWSFRSISFSKKDKSKPAKDAEKNGDVKEVPEEGAEETATTPSVEEPTKAVTEAGAGDGEVKTPDTAPVTNGDTTPAEEAAAAVKVEETTPKVDEQPVEEKPVEVVKEAPVEATPAVPVDPTPAAPVVVEEVKVTETSEEPVQVEEVPAAAEPSPVKEEIQAVPAEAEAVVETKEEAAAVVVEDTQTPVAVEVAAAAPAELDTKEVPAAAEIETSTTESAANGETDKKVEVSPAPATAVEE